MTIRLNISFISNSIRKEWCCMKRKMMIESNKKHTILPLWIYIDKTV